jgi:glycosyltransferase involved in cell wall biosynthesis
MEKKISVVVPTLKRTALLEKCMSSLCHQNLPLDDFEIIVVSDGPDEDTRLMLNHFTERHPFIQLISLQKHKGPAAARNAGWRAAASPVIAFTDDDCIADPDWLQQIINEYTVRGRPDLFAISGKVVVPLPEQPTDFALNTYRLQTASFITANCACTKKSLELTGGFDERFTTAWREDSDLEFKLTENNISIVKLENAIVIHPVRKIKWGISIREQRKTLYNALLYKKYPHLFRKKIQPLPAWNYYVIVFSFFAIFAGVATQNVLFTILSLMVYLVFTVAFIIKRLHGTSKTPDHIAEMIVTSLVIPFSSIYWTLYGSIRYRVFYY